MSLGILTYTTQQTGVPPSSTDTYASYLLSGAVGMTARLRRVPITFFVQGGYDRAPAIHDLIGDTHDSGGFSARRSGLRLRLGDGTMRRDLKPLAPLLVARVSASATLGGDCEGDIVQDPTFRDWCGDSLCAWHLDAGHVAQAPDVERARPRRELRRHAGRRSRRRPPSRARSASSSRASPTSIPRRT